MPALLSVSGVSKSYPGLPVLKEASFEVDQGEIVCLLGPSGCGKTTLLRIVSGLEMADTGTVRVDGRDMARVPVHRRNFGFMFQDYALFPHKDVEANVAFGLRMQRLPPKEIGTRVREALELVELAGYERRRVVELSGGEQQRVALARSPAPRPRLLLLDEPLGSLDRTLREQLMNELRAILKRVGVTAVYVTHDQGEAFAVSDRVLIMRARPEHGEGGWIEQMGTPAEVYRYPRTLYVAQFLGFKNLLAGTVVAAPAGVAAGRGDVRGEASATASVAGAWAETVLGSLYAGDARGLFNPGERVTVLVRPEAADLRRPDDTGVNIVRGRLLEASFRGSYYLIRTQHAGDAVLTCEASAVDAELPEPGETLAICLDPAAVTLMK